MYSYLIHIQVTLRLPWLTSLFYTGEWRVGKISGTFDVAQFCLALFVWHCDSAAIFSIKRGPRGWTRPIECTFTSEEEAAASKRMFFSRFLNVFRAQQNNCLVFWSTYICATQFTHFFCQNATHAHALLSCSRHKMDQLQCLQLALYWYTNEWAGTYQFSCTSSTTPSPLPAIVWPRLIYVFTSRAVGIMNVACSRRSDSGGAMRKDARRAKREEWRVGIGERGRRTPGSNRLEKPLHTESGHVRDTLACPLS